MTVAESHPSGPGISTVVTPAAPETDQAKPAGTTAFGEMKRLAVLVGVAVLVALLGSCAAGFGVSQAGGIGLVTVLRDLGIMILALVSLAIALIWGGIYFGLAWVVGHFGGRIPAGLRWVNGKVAVVEGATDRGAERFVVRPLAATAGRLTEGRTFLSRLGSGVDATTAPVRRWSREVTAWPTLQHRLRWGTSNLPATLRGTSVTQAQDVTVAPTPEE
ncbi:MAG: hypothetical protein M3442_11360 [Chloroflexota bacterium]|nr:hypothetical protein [Chloroflexota bacterium]